MFGLFNSKDRKATIKSLLATARELGRLARMRGEPISSNPYKGGAYGFNAWANGWESEDARSQP